MKMFDAGKTRMIGLPYGEKNCDDMLSRFHLIPERYGRTDRRTNRRTDLLYQYRAIKVVECTISSKQNVSMTLISLAIDYAASRKIREILASVRETGDRGRNTGAPGKYGRSGNPT